MSRRHRITNLPMPRKSPPRFDEAGSFGNQAESSPMPQVAESNKSVARDGDPKSDRFRANPDCAWLVRQLGGKSETRETLARRYDVARLVKIGLLVEA